jgi:predicted AlkP superfamily pyrophosphatase or phosphodiesterase
LSISSRALRRLSFLIFLPGLALSAAQSPNGRPPVLMISVDGMRPDYITQADAHGLHVPVLRSFMEHGTYADGVIGVVPTVTFPSHATLITGVWPEGHGIYNNTLFDPLNRTKGAWYWYGSDFRAATLWHAAAQAGIVTASVFWPTTTDADDINYLIPAYPARNREDASLMEAISRPVGYLEKLERQAGPFYILDSELKFDDLLTRTSVALIHDAKPGFMTLHLVSLDSFEHASGPFSPASNNAMEKTDQMIGQLVDAERANDPRAIILVVSDHGFAATHTSVSLMIPFVQAGLITIGKPAANSQLSITSWRAMVWNAGGAAYVVLRDPEDEQLLSQVKNLLDSLRQDPRYGIDRILTHTEIMARGGDPDASFLVDWKPGFSAGGRLEGGITSAISGTGTHGYLPDHPEMEASFFAVGRDIPAHCDAGTIDMRQIAPTVASWMGVSLPDATLPPVHCRP